MNISGPAAVAKPEMLFYAPGDLTVTAMMRSQTLMALFKAFSSTMCKVALTLKLTWMGMNF